MQHTGIVERLILGERTQRDGTRDVRSTVQVVSPRVEQIESARLQHAALLGRSRVVRQGCILTVCRDGRKALVEVALHLLAQADELVRRINLRDALALGQCPFEPAEEASLHDTILAVSLTEALYLRFILQRLLQLHR